MLHIIYKPIFYIIFKLLGILSLSRLHRLGALLGQLVYWCTPESASITRQNIHNSGLTKNAQQFKQILDKSIAESGKAVLETISIWQMKPDKLLPLVKQVHGWNLIEDALQEKKGIIFLTPHLGCFEITSIYYGAHHPITVLYRPPKLGFLQQVIEQGRQRPGVTLAEANTQGVRRLMQALKRGEAIGILPDQIPAEGEGEWADFFGKPAYTMTLASKLAEKTGAAIIMAFGERLPDGQGYVIHLTPVQSIATASLLNQAIEQQIAQKPEQYLWCYNRWKQRRHAIKQIK